MYANMYTYIHISACLFAAKPILYVCTRVLVSMHTCALQCVQTGLRIHICAYLITTQLPCMNAHRYTYMWKHRCTYIHVCACLFAAQPTLYLRTHTYVCALACIDMCTCSPINIGIFICKRAAHMYIHMYLCACLQGGVESQRMSSLHR